MGGGGGTPIFYIHICLADFGGFKILNFNIFLFFFRKYDYSLGWRFLWIFLGVTSKLDNFMGYFFKLSAPTWCDQSLSMEAQFGTLIVMV